MAYWIFKCNARNHPYQVAVGDWDEFFSRGRSSEWGSTEWVPALAKASPGDTILAYQTDRNELVGITVVEKFRKRGAYKDLILRPIEEVRVKVRPLKRSFQNVARIKALQSGPIHTLYSLTDKEAISLMRAAGIGNLPNLNSHAPAEQLFVRGGGFGTAEENRKVDQASMSFVRSSYHRKGWKTVDVSRLNCGYDLECRRQGLTLHVEVKGTRGTGQQFIVTNNEVETWKRDSHFRVALVTNALTKPRLFEFHGPNSMEVFDFTPIAFMCRKRRR